MSVQVSYKKQMVVGIFFLLIIVVVIEGVLRTYEVFNPECRMLGKDAVNDLDISLQKQICLDLRSLSYDQLTYPIMMMKPNQHFPTFNVNSFGFRGDEITLEKPENTYRIFVVGGSTVVGVGSSSNENTIPGFLQKRFNDEKLPYKIEVINAGVAGANSFDENFYIKNLLLKFNPDLFIIYNGANDARDQILEPGKRGIFKMFKIYIHEINYRTPIIISDFLLRTYSSTQIQSESVNDNTVDKIISNWKNRANEICQLVKEEKISVIIAVQPMVDTGKILSHDERNYAPFDERRAGVLEIIDGFADSLSELEQTCEKTVDLREIFNGISEPMFIDDVHLNDHGNKLVADKLFEITFPIVKDSIP